MLSYILCIIFGSVILLCMSVAITTTAEVDYERQKKENKKAYKGV